MNNLCARHQGDRALFVPRLQHASAIEEPTGMKTSRGIKLQGIMREGTSGTFGTCSQQNSEKIKPANERTDIANTNTSGSSLITSSIETGCSDRQLTLRKYTELS